MIHRYIPLIRRSVKQSSYQKMQQSIVNCVSNNTDIVVNVNTNPFHAFTSQIRKQREKEVRTNIWENSVFVDLPKLQSNNVGNVGEDFMQAICQGVGISCSIDGVSNKQLGGGGKDGIIMDRTVEIKTAHQGSKTSSFQHELGEKPWLSEFMIFIDVAPQTLYITIFNNFSEDVYKGHGKLEPVFPTKSVTWRKNQGAFKLDTTVAINETNCQGDNPYTFKLVSDSTYDDSLKNFLVARIK